MTVLHNVEQPLSRQAPYGASCLDWRVSARRRDHAETLKSHSLIKPLTARNARLIERMIWLEVSPLQLAANPLLQAADAKATAVRCQPGFLPDGLANTIDPDCCGKRRAPRGLFAGTQHRVCLKGWKKAERGN
jgi:hypothetical protein